MKKIVTFLFASAVNLLAAQTVTTIAGSGISGDVDGIGTAANLKSPRGIICDAGGKVYFADIDNHKIKMLFPSSGMVTTFAGTGQAGLVDGPALSAKFNRPQSMCLDNAGNMYVAEFDGTVVRKISTTGVVSTLAGTNTAGYADGTGSAARFGGLTDIVADASGNLYVSDYGNHCIRKITPAGVVSTFAGTTTPGYSDGSPTAARFSYPHGLAIDAVGRIYVADRSNNRIRRIDAAGAVTTYAGDGTSGSKNGSILTCNFNAPLDVDVDANNNVYVADSGSDQVRLISASGVVTTLCGRPGNGYQDGDTSVAKFNFPTGVCAGANGVVYITDYSNNRVRKYVPAPLNTTGIKEQSIAKSLIVFPNPATNEITVEQTGNNSSIITIYDVTGRQIEKEATSSGTINISTLDKGVYYLILVTPEGSKHSSKFIKQ
jgi:sugar lactone lactonase YvrE